MRKLIVSEFVSLDGVMQAPGHPDEDRSGGFEHGGWQMPYADLDEGQLQAIGEAIAATDAYLFGRRTYEIFAAYWPQQPDTDMFARTLNGLPKYVASRTLAEPLPWEGSILLGGDVASEVARLKEQQGGNISVLGSGELVQTLLRHDLVDELVLMVSPVVVGSGKRLFRDGLSPTPLRLLDSRSTAGGVLTLTYGRTGAASAAASAPTA